MCTCGIFAPAVLDLSGYCRARFFTACFVIPWYAVRSQSASQPCVTQFSSRRPVGSLLSASLIRNGLKSRLGRAAPCACPDPSLLRSIYGSFRSRCPGRRWVPARTRSATHRDAIYGVDSGVRLFIRRGAVCIHGRSFGHAMAVSCEFETPYKTCV